MVIPLKRVRGGIRVNFPNFRIDNGPEIDMTHGIARVSPDFARGFLLSYFFQSVSDPADIRTLSGAPNTSAAARIERERAAILSSLSAARIAEGPFFHFITSLVAPRVTFHEFHSWLFRSVMEFGQDQVPWGRVKTSFLDRRSKNEFSAFVQKSK